MRQKKKLTHYQIWLMPIVLGVLSCIGLVAALLLDNIGDLTAWITLAMPLLVIIYYWLMKKSKGSE